MIQLPGVIRASPLNPRTRPSLTRYTSPLCAGITAQKADSIQVVTNPSRPPTFDDYSYPGFAHPGEPRRAVTYQIPAALNHRTNGAVRWAGDTGAVPGVESKVDLVRLSLNEFLTELENQHHGGHSFPPPDNTRRGRGTERDTAWDKITIQLPESLIIRAAGAVAFLTRTALLPEITSTNRLVAQAVDRYVTRLEHDHRNGRAFKDPRRRLTPGRPRQTT